MTAGVEVGIALALLAAALTNAASLLKHRGCQGCHTGEPGAASPPLLGRFGMPTRIKGDGSVAMDEPYIRESILDPGVRITEGYEPIMPSYRGLVSEEGILQIIQYLKAGPMPTTAPAAPSTGTDRNGRRE